MLVIFLFINLLLFDIFSLRSTNSSVSSSSIVKILRLFSFNSLSLTKTAAASSWLLFNESTLVKVLKTKSSICLAESTYLYSESILDF